LIKILGVLFIILLISLFLPWTQHIRSKGYVTTLNPYDKPQSIQPLLGGQINLWHVKEGDVVMVGDTIVTLTESKEEYLDPDLIANTEFQKDAKISSANAYSQKINLLTKQLALLENNRENKLAQIKIKLDQLKLKKETANQELDAAVVYSSNATKQLERMQLMYDKGIKPLTDLEQKKLSQQEANAKQISAKNKISQLDNDVTALSQDVQITMTDFDQKIAKVKSEIQSADSYRISLDGDQNKLQSKINQLSKRQNAFVILSPIEGRITKIMKNGIGEFVKSSEEIATIVPTNFQKAVELYIVPNDMPLVLEGKRVRLQFDGWPSVIFSGWPNNSFGTFPGKVVAIDNDISENGKYRILVIEDASEKPWPESIRIGSGAQGLLLLNDVRVYYEIWRQLNGFPQDFYAEQKEGPVKRKAPIKKIK